MKPTKTMAAVGVLCLVVTGLGITAWGAEKELIEGDVFSHFRPTKLWATAGDVAAIDG